MNKLYSVTRKLSLMAVFDCVALAVWADAGSLSLRSAKSYVRDDLYAQYDGIENVGYGQSDAESTARKDLTGKHNDATYSSGTPAWTELGWKETRSEKCFFTVGEAALLSGLGTSWTIQTYVQPTSSWLANYGGIGGNHGASVAMGVMLRSKKPKNW